MLCLAPYVGSPPLLLQEQHTFCPCDQPSPLPSCLLQVPLDHSNKQGATITLFVRDVSALSKIGHKLPTLLFLQGLSHLKTVTSLFFASMSTQVKSHHFAHDCVK